MVFIVNKSLYGLYSESVIMFYSE